MRTIKLVVVSAALLASVAGTAVAQGGGGRGGAGVMTAAGAGGGGGRGAGGAGGGAFGRRGVTGLFAGTTVAADSAILAAAAAIGAKYQMDIAAGTAGRAGTPADSLVAKAKVATTKRNDELKALLKSEADKKKFDENVAAASAPRGGGGF